MVNAHLRVTEREERTRERQEKRAFVQLTIKKTTAKDHDDDLDADYSGQLFFLQLMLVNIFVPKRRNLWG